MSALVTKVMGGGMAAGLAANLLADVQNSMTAAGTSQTDAQKIGAATSRFTTVASGSGAILPSGAIGDECLVINAGANALSLYPPSGHAINAGSTNAALSVASTGSVIVKRVTNTLWIAQDASQLLFLQSGTGATSRSVQDVFYDAVSVMDFIPSSLHSAIRAKTDTTDLSTYIQAAIDAVKTNGGCLYFPLGTYTYGTTLAFNADNVALVGQPSFGDTSGANYKATSVLSYTGSSAAMTFGDSTATNNRTGLHIEHIKFAGTASATYGLRVYRSNFNVIRDVLFDGFSAASAVALSLEDRAQMIRLDRVAISNCYDGVALVKTNNQVWFRDCYINNNTGRGVHIGSTASGTASTKVHFDGGIIEFNTLGNVVIDNGDSVTFHGTYFENILSGIYSIIVGDITGAGTSSVCDAITIRDCYFNGNGVAQYAIQCSAKRFESLLIEGNEFSNYTTAAIDNSAVDIATNQQGYIYAPYNRPLSNVPALFASYHSNNGVVSYTQGEINVTGQTVKLYDEFLGDVLADQWNGQVGTDAACVTPTITAALGGVVRLVTGANASADMAGNGVQMDSQLNWRASSQALMFEVRVKLSSITSVALYVGFTDQVSSLEMPFTLGAGDALTSNATNACGFLFDTGADTDTWHGVGVKADADATTQNFAVAPTGGTYETLRVELSVGGAATFYRNGTIVGSAMSNAVTVSTVLTPVVAAFSRSAASRNIDVDYVWVEARRV